MNDRKGFSSDILPQEGGSVKSTNEHKTKPSYKVNQEKLYTAVEWILEHRKKGYIYPESGFAWTLCPFHDDHNPSLRINLKTGHFDCMACKETGSFIKLWQKLQGYEGEEGYKKAIEELKKIGVLMEEKPVEVAVYSYYDHTENARLLFRKRKFVRPDGSKYFVIEHYDYENDRWLSGKPKNCPPVLYNYDAVVFARYNGGTLFFVEGEKDAETLKSLGFLATTCGGSNDWKTELAGEFAGLEVVIIPDNDPAGKELLISVGRDLLNFASSVSWIDLSEEAGKLGINFPEKGDITGFLELVKQAGKDPVEVFKSLTKQQFDPKELKERVDNELLNSIDLTLSEEYLDAAENLEFLFQGFLPWGYAIVLSSEPGEGKTMLAYALAKEAIKNGYRVIYLDGDNPLPYIKENLQKFGLKSELRKKLFYFSRHTREFSISLTDEVWKAIKRMLRQISRSFVVVDTYGSMSRGFDTNADKDMREVMSEIKTLRDAGHAVLILHHTQKYASKDETISAGFKYRGSGVIKSDADGLYFMEREKTDYILYAGKLRFMGEEKLRISFTAEGLNIIVDQTSKKQKEAITLLELIEEGKTYNQRQLIEWAKYKLGFGRDKVRELLLFLEENGYIEVKGGKGGQIIKRKGASSDSNTLRSEEDFDVDDLPF